MNIKINSLHIHLSDSFFASDAFDPDHAADALDPEVFVEPADPVMPDEEPPHSGLDPQQEVEAAIANACHSAGAALLRDLVVAVLAGDYRRCLRTAQA